MYQYKETEFIGPYINIWTFLLLSSGLGTKTLHIDWLQSVPGLEPLDRAWSRY